MKRFIVRKTSCSLALISNGSSRMFSINTSGLDRVMWYCDVDNLPSISIKAGNILLGWSTVTSVVYPISRKDYASYGIFLSTNMSPPYTHTHAHIGLWCGKVSCRNWRNLEMSDLGLNIQLLSLLSATGPYSEPDEPSPYLHILFL